MSIPVKYFLGVLFIVLALASRAQGQYAVSEVLLRVGDASSVNSSPVLIPLDSLTPRPSDRMHSNIKFLCGSCGGSTTPSVYLYIIRKKPLPISVDDAGLIQAAWIETINFAKGEHAKKYGSLAKTNGAVIITFKKAFKQQVLAALPEDFKKLHKL